MGDYRAYTSFSDDRCSKGRRVGAVGVVSGLVVARPAVDSDEQGRVKKLAGARHAPKDWVIRARIVVSSWEEEAVPQIAERVGCSARTARA
jgi:hypothetical protein